ncbi:hypothetical protein VTI74DRAFT_2575 [Chaetomium olivicolor]
MAAAVVDNGTEREAAGSTMVSCYQQDPLITLASDLYDRTSPASAPWSSTLAPATHPIEVPHHPLQFATCSACPPTLHPGVFLILSCSSPPGSWKCNPRLVSSVIRAAFTKPPARGRA